MNISECIKDKRNQYGLTIKEFSDALALGNNGEDLLRAWENGEPVADPELEKRIITFGENAPSSNKRNAESSRFLVASSSTE